MSHTDDQVIEPTDSVDEYEQSDDYKEYLLEQEEAESEDD
jgi:hypothetical protein